MIQTGRVVEWWFAVFGLMRIGAVAVPGTSLLVAKGQSYLYNLSYLPTCTLTRKRVDLKYRAESSKAVAFIGDQNACSRFEEISSSVGINHIYQVKSDDGEGDEIGKGRIDFVKSLNEVGEIGKNENVECEHKKTDLAIVFFTSGTTSNPKLVLLEAEYSESRFSLFRRYILFSDFVEKVTMS